MNYRKRMNTPWPKEEKTLEQSGDIHIPPDPISAPYVNDLGLTQKDYATKLISGASVSTAGGWRNFKPEKSKSDLVLDKIREFCGNLEEKLITKYLAGQKEHGDDWAGLDLGYEMSLEVLDLINYGLMRIVRDDITNK